MPDWKVIRNEYEIMHTSVKELSSGHHVSESMIEYAIKTDGWKRIEADDANLDKYSEKLALMGSMNDMALVPKFIQLQQRLLDKCDDLLNGVKSIENAADLKIVSEVIERHRPAVLKVAEKGGDDKQFNIRIMTQAGDKDAPSIAAVEISPHRSIFQWC